MFTFLKSLLRTAILPPSGPLVLCVVGLLLERRHPRLGRALVITGVATLWIIAMPIFGDALLRVAQRCPPLDISKPTNAQAIVILGGGYVRNAPEYGGLTIGSTTLERLNYGAYLSRQLSLPIAFSGAPDEAVGTRNVLRQVFNIEPRWVEGKSGDTFQNARYSARILLPAGIHRILLITSGAHEYRSVQEFTGAGFEVTPAPVGDLADEPLHATDFMPGIEGLTHSYAAIYELIGEPVRVFFAVTHLRRQEPGG